MYSLQHLHYHLGLGVVDNKTSNQIPSAYIREHWLASIESTVQAVADKTWFQGYDSDGSEIAWFGYRTYQGRATILAFLGYDNGSIVKGYRDKDGNWSFYYLFGRT